MRNLIDYFIDFTIATILFVLAMFVVNLVFGPTDTARPAEQAVECYRAPSQRDRCLCLTRVAAKDSNFNEHADEACKEVP